jgi:hypothetical protein
MVVARLRTRRRGLTSRAKRQDPPDPGPDRSERVAAVQNAIDSARIEDLTVSHEALRLLTYYADGRISADEMIELTAKLHAGN